MRVRIIRTTAVKATVVRPGDEVDVTESDARILIGGRKAVRVAAPSVAAGVALEPDNPVRRRGRPRKEP